MFENTVLGKVFGPKMDKVAREWRRLHNEEICDLYCLTKYYSCDKIKKNGMGDACGTNGGESRIAYGLLKGGKRGGKKILGRYRRGRDNNIKMNLYGHMDVKSNQTHKILK